MVDGVAIHQILFAQSVDIENNIRSKIMAEYISKDKLKRKKVYHFQTKDGAFPKSEPFIKLDDISNIPPADVVEREKINQAIEEIEKQRKITIECDGESDLGVAIRIIKKYLGG